MSSPRPILFMVLVLSACHADSEIRVGHGSIADADDTGTSDMNTVTSDDPAPLTSGFVPDYDTPSATTCDPFAQDCEPGFKCVPYGSTGGNWDANKCVEVLGDGKVGEPCTYDGVVEATDSCDATSMCWNIADIDGEAIGTCTAFCSGTPDDPECPAGSSCSISCDGSLNVCMQQCDPLAQDCLGLGCYYDFAGGFSCIFTTENIEDGQPCGFINDCRPGLVCVNSEVVPDCQGSACCTKFCDLAAPDCTLPGTECGPFFEQGSAPPDLEDLGICMLPPE